MFSKIKIQRNKKNFDSLSFLITVNSVKLLFSSKKVNVSHCHKFSDKKMSLFNLRKGAFQLISHNNKLSWQHKHYIVKN
jgi:hypothetical protein